MRLAYYAGASTAAAAACLLKAFHERPNFYSATVYLSQSNACLLILTNLLLVCAVTFMYCLQRVLYGPLRPIEIEQLSEKAWYAVLDTLLAMPSFREDVGGWLLTMFVLLLAGKVWGWIAEGRVDVLEQQPPANPRLFHARLATSLIVSVAFDLYMTYYCFETVAADPRPGMMVIFTFEFAILSIFSIFTLLRYQLNVIATEITKQQTVKAIEERKKEIRAERAAAQQQQQESDGSAPPAPSPDEPVEVDENEVDVPGWEEKRRYLFALEVFTDFTKLVLYVIFFTVSITFNGLPMHIMRDVYMTFAAFSKRLSDYVNYKKATSDMNARYPDATSTEIRDDSCIVCRETMVAWEETAANGAAPEAGNRPRRDEGLRAKKLPCGHILHLRCLKAWLERQQVCPTCRRPVLTAAPSRLVRAAGVADGLDPAAPAAAAAAAAAAPPPPPAQAGHAAAAQGRPNRARFFNLGPVRIGFLNGPAGQVNDIVNQLQGNAPRQDAAGNDATTARQPQSAPPTQTALSGTNASSSTSRLSQDELMQMQQRLIREAQQLGLEQAQLHTLRSMSIEMQNLLTLHAHTAAQQASQPQPAARGPNVLNGPLSQGVPATSLAGFPEQQMAANSADLPAGVTLPQGWSLMPLHLQTNGAVRVVNGNSTPTAAHAPTQVNAAPHVPGPPQQSSSVPAAQNTQPALSSQPATAAPVESVPINETNTGPTDPSGSPLFVPATEAPKAASTTSQTAAEPSRVSNGPADHEDTRGTATEPSASLANGHATTNAPWQSSGWDFDGAAEKIGTAAADKTAQTDAPQPSSHNKGKARAVEVEEVTDSQT